jgi:hypothetical protein
MDSSSKTSKALLFIPDISGFTEFVHFTEISHSKHIISELLEILLDANTSGLQLAEIEGDALFFYKKTDKINAKELEEQIKKMYMAFHTHLKRYEYERICQCGACSSAYNLSLKFVSHFGEIDFLQVKDNVKPYGSNVIQVHRLLKNDIDVNEYALFTDKIKIKRDDLINSKSTYDFGEIEYNYQNLEVLKEELPYVPPIPLDVPKHKMFSISRVVDFPILDLYEVISNFDYRLLWIKGVDKLSYKKDLVNRNGTKHKCLLDKNKEVNQITVSKKVEPNQYVYGESTSEAPFMKRLNVYYVLEETNEGTSVLAEGFADFKPLGQILKPIFSKKLKNNITEALNELILLLDSGFKLNNHITYDENDK